ncbi:hypothetical protein G4B88_007854 [Cannabis sativa]|uniref:Uncharacterized protein n=1 Tax=Cannabis sativa TaxID=3483 RepID=A0A7J6DTD2_CANSA|nr:hypothetical protein G4B88_007854 [Cannabis sativa]
MHLWPSTKLRDSFKFPYVRNLDRKTSQMRAEKRASAALQQNLLDAEAGASVNGKMADNCQNSEGQSQSRFIHICKMVLLSLTCGCCCCGGGLSVFLTTSYLSDINDVMVYVLVARNSVAANSVCNLWTVKKKD